MLMPSIFGENLFDTFYDFARPMRTNTRFAQSANVMRTDVRENENGFELDIDLPGYKKEDIQAELKDGYLTVSASTDNSEEKKEEDGRYIRRERYIGSCSRTFYVGDEMEQEDIKAKFENGILKLFVPKKEAKPQIEENHLISIEG